MYGLYRVATLIFSCTRARIHQFGGPEMFSHKTSQKTAKLAIFRLQLKLHQNSKNKRKNRLRKQSKRECQNDQNLCHFHRRFDFHKERKKDPIFRETFYKYRTRKSSWKKRAFLVIHKMLKHVAETALFLTVI